MYMTPTEIRLSNGSPVRPSYNTVLPSRAIPASSIVDHTSSSFAPSNTGDATWMPKFLAAIPKSQVLVRCSYVMVQVQS